MSADQSAFVSQSGSQSGNAALRIALWLVLLLFLNLQGDGFHLSVDPRRDQLLLLPLTLVFCALLGALLSLRGGLHPPRFAWLTNSRTLLTIAAATLVPTLAVLVASARHYASFHYRLPLWPTSIIFFAAACLLLNASRRPVSAIRRGSDTAAVLGASVALQLLCLRSFPLDIRRSDMLPLLAAAGRAFHLGIDPYRQYTFPTETVLLTYLPGTLLAYLPATLLHLDLRLTNVVCLTVTALLVARAAAPAHRRQLVALLTIWLLSPYLIYRHELYTPPHWLAVTFALVLLHRGRLTASAVIFGIGIALSQFSWILLPFVLLHVWEGHRSRRMLSYAALALLTAALLVLPFIAWSPHNFYFGVLSHWQHQAVSARPVNFSFWLASLLTPRVLEPVQLLVLATLFLSSVAFHSCTSFTGLLSVLSLALAAFTLLNILVWGYFFLLLELLLLLFVAAANGWLRRPDLPAPAP